MGYKFKSMQERNQKEMPEKNLTYGEITFKAMAECFQYIKKKYNAFPDSQNGKNYGKFIDLGHGSGKGVLSGALFHPFRECMGIEILDGLFNTSVILKERY